MMQIGASRCFRCALPREPFDDEACRSCERWPDAIHRVHAHWRYEGAMVDAMHRVKRSRSLWVLKSLVDVASSELADASHGCEFVTTIPTSRERLVQRGFDVPSLIARWSGLEAERALEYRARAESQKFLGRDERWMNMRGRFESRPVRGRWLLIDDILTTGATANAAARALREAGAERVEVFVLGRTPRYT